MEKPPKPMTKIFRFLPRAASAIIAFQNLPFNPGRDKIGPSERANNHHHHHHHNNNNNHRFSGPLISNKSFDELGFDGPEPTSPKISCMGQIKHETSKIKANKDKIEDRTKQGSKLKRFFSGKLEKKAEPLVRSSVRDDCSRLPDRAPSLSQAKRFASGRDVLADFDWLAPFTPVDKERRNYYSDDEERGGRTSGRWEEYEDGDEDKEDIIIPFSAPLPVGTRPRKEVNLWKRRTMAPPRPLQLQYEMVIGG